jgi:hypothetical protein
MSDDPWQELTSPSAADAINARRVDADFPWGFFWARGVDGRCLLALQHAADSTPRGRLPNLKGVELAVWEGDRNGEPMLVLKLLDFSQRDIFHRLCTDIVASTSNAATEREAVQIALARTWRWHHLLRGGKDERLSLEEQKGLIGELLVMERHLLLRASALDAVSSWRGPLGAPKDFEIGRVCIEVKAHRGAAAPYVVVNSEHQLDTAGTDELFLYVVELDQAPSDAKGSFTVSDVAIRVRNRIAGIDESAVVPLDDLLSAAGFRWEDDYSDSNWTEGASRVYRVDDGFPCITTPTIMPGVSTVKYSIALAACEPFRVPVGVLASALGGKHGNRA